MVNMENSKAYLQELQNRVMSNKAMIYDLEQQNKELMFSISLINNIAKLEEADKPEPQKANGLV